MPKTYDLTVTIGEYTDKDGNAKKRRINIGSIITNDKGNTFMMLSRHFNPAGVPCEATADSIIVSMFPVDGNDRPQQSRSSGVAPHRQPAQDHTGLDDDLPF